MKRFVFCCICFVLSGLSLVSAQEAPGSESQARPTPRPNGTPTPTATATERPRDIRNSFMPGVSASLIKPFENSRLYVGGSLHYTLIHGITSARGREAFGGYYESYAEIGVYKEMASRFDQDVFFTWLLGVNLSFEKFLDGRREFFIPYFGAKLGGVFFNRSSQGGFLAQPVLGLVLVSTSTVNLTCDAAMFLNTASMSDYIGVNYTMVLSINF